MTKAVFDLRAPFSPAGDQPKAIAELTRGLERGDRFQPFGLGGSRKLSDFFIDRKVPRAARNLIPLVVDAEKILWVGGMRLDERARVLPESKRVIRLVVGRL